MWDSELKIIYIWYILKNVMLIRIIDNNHNQIYYTIFDTITKYLNKNIHLIFSDQ